MVGLLVLLVLVLAVASRPRLRVYHVTAPNGERIAFACPSDWQVALYKRESAPPLAADDPVGVILAVGRPRDPWLTRLRAWLPFGRPARGDEWNRDWSVTVTARTWWNTNQPDVRRTHGGEGRLPFSILELSRRSMSSHILYSATYRAYWRPPVPDQDPEMKRLQPDLDRAFRLE